MGSILVTTLPTTLPPTAAAAQLAQPRSQQQQQQLANAAALPRSGAQLHPLPACTSPSQSDARARSVPGHCWQLLQLQALQSATTRWHRLPRPGTTGASRQISVARHAAAADAPAALPQCAPSSEESCCVHLRRVLSLAWFCWLLVHRLLVQSSVGSCLECFVATHTAAGHRVLQQQQRVTEQLFFCFFTHFEGGGGADAHR